jgi:Tannase and feruloyl esterase
MRMRLLGQRRTSRVLVAAAVLTATVSMGANAAAAEVAPATGHATSITPAMSCNSLAGKTVSAGNGTPGVVTAAAVTTQAGIAYCQVSGYVSPQAKFELLLPQTTFQGDYLQEGCGGFCGFIPLTQQPDAATGCAPATGGQFAIGADNEGHDGASAADGAWAANDMDLRVQYAYLSEHALAILAKSIISVYYGAGPKYSYFDGCSDGGREGLEEAQRYPQDFNGILSGSPGLDTPGIVGLLFPWLIQSNTAPGGAEILTSEKLPALHAAVLAACANRDGVIVDPRACTFNPASTECRPEVDDAACLTPAQVAVVRRFYLGPADAAGKSLYDGGMPYGSELAWQSWIVMPAGDAAWPEDTFAYQTSVNYLRYMGFYPNPPSSFSPYSVQFTDAYFQRMQRFADLYNAADPDLSQFRRDGGKLVIYQGWEDQLATPWDALDYYAAVERTAGGYSQSQAFSRLYMIPGGYHCLSGGDPAVTVDLLTPLVNWVEHGTAPASINVAVTSQTSGNHIASLTVAPFDAAAPAPVNQGLNSAYRYIGIRSTYEPKQTWCTQEGFTLVCKRS